MAEESAGRVQAQLDTRALEIAIEARTEARSGKEECRMQYQQLHAEVAAHNIDTNRRFDHQDKDRDQKHTENQGKFDRLFRAQYIAMGSIAAVSAVLSALLSPPGQRLFALLLHP